MSRRSVAVCCFLPPHVLRSIAENGNEAQREHAHAALELSAQERGARAAHAHAAGAAAAVAEVSAAAPRLRREVYDARQKTSRGVLVRAEGAKPTRDAAADEAYDGAGKTYDFYANALQRSSVDGKGLPLISSVHYGVKYANAMWNGQQMLYGDGDGKIFGRFTMCLEIIGHELTHGVTQYTAALRYQDQSGALNEHFSDVFGVLVKQYSLKQTAAKADWLVGAGLFARGVHGVAVRSMKAPGTAYDDKLLGRDPQPAHMRDFRKMTADNGGVHINSGIPNHAFYLAATAIGGKAWEVAGRIWYDALTTKLKSTADFRDCARATVAAAAERYGATSEPRAAVVEAWRAVGIDVEAIATKGPKLAVAAADAEFQPPAGGAEVPAAPAPRRAPRRAAR